MSRHVAWMGRLFAANAVAMSALLASCGGGGGGSSGGSGDAGPPTALAVAGVEALDSDGKIDHTIVDGALNGDPNVTISVIFNVAIEAATATPAAFVLAAQGVPVAMTVTVGTSAVTLKPTQPLLIGTHYQLTIKAGITAQNGTVLASDDSLGFTTAPIAFRSVALAPIDQQLVSGRPPILAVADLNGDGRPDLVQLANLPESTAPLVQGYSLRLFAQQVDGTFALFQKIDTVTSTTDPYQMSFPRVFIADVDGDGIPEIVVPESSAEGGSRGFPVNQQMSGLRIYKRNGAGMFAASGFVNTDYLASIVMLDVDGDGRPDFVGAGGDAGGVQVIHNTGAGLSALAPVGPLRCACEFAVADLNHDGHRELIVDNVGEFDGTGSAVPPAISVYAIGPSGVLVQDAALTQSMSGVCAGFTNCSAMAVLDINGDGLPDLFFGNVFSQALTAAIPYFRQAGGGFTAGATLSIGSNSPVVIAADLNGDGTSELAIIDTVFSGGALVNALAVLFPQGSTTFRASPAYAIPEEESLTPPAVAIADINGDGLPDIVLVGQNEGITVMLQVK